MTFPSASGPARFEWRGYGKNSVERADPAAPEEHWARSQIRVHDGLPVSTGSVRTRDACCRSAAEARAREAAGEGERDGTRDHLREPCAISTCLHVCRVLHW